jgi:ATP-dependent helicase HrpB
MRGQCACVQTGVAFVVFSPDEVGMADVLPIDDVLDELLVATRAQGCAVLQAPPRAGKTTRVPLALLDADIVSGKIIMLEPRRLAVRGAA